jgi:hypothetical protein
MLQEALIDELAEDREFTEVVRLHFSVSNWKI